MLRRYPLLGAEVRGGQTRTPHFAWRDEPLTPNDILSEQTLGRDVSRDEILVQAIAAAESAPADGPLWHVVRYLTANASYLAVSAQHELLDGIGLLRLVLALTADDISSLPSEPFETMIGMSTSEYKPTLRFLLPLIYSEMVIPVLPEWLQAYARTAEVWPTEIDLHPSKAPWAVSTMSIDLNKVSELSKAGKLRGVKTLHPIFEVAYLSAVRYVFGSDAPDASFIGTTPRNERDVSSGHAYLTGNYTSSFQWTLPTEISFWSACRACYHHMNSPTGIAAARQRMGLLAYLPDPDPPRSSSDSRRATGWEDSYTTKFENGTNTYRQTASFSNLGRAALPTGATDMIWGFPASPFAPPLSLAIIGHEAGVRFFTTWREGCPVTVDKARQVDKRFLENLDRAIAGEDFPLTKTP